MKNTIIIFFIILTLQNCNIQTTDILKNEYIPVDIKEQIKKLNSEFFQGLKNRDFSSIKSLMADTLLNMGIENNGFIKTMSSVINPENYKILDEYHLKNLVIGESTIITSGKANDTDYSINFTPLTKETYISLLLPTGANQDFLVTVVYGKYNNKWKINILLFGQRRLYGKTTPEYYRIALNSYSKSQLFDALYYISLSKLISHPAKSFYIFNIDQEINDFDFKIKKEIKSNYQIPFVVKSIQSHPIIIGFDMKVLKKDFCPIVDYVTTLSIEDTTALKEENSILKDVVKQQFPGIYKGERNVYYKAYNEIPNGTKAINFHSFVDNDRE